MYRKIFIIITILVEESILGETPCPFLGRKLIFAHRGGDINNFPENTLEIFTQAAKNGYSLEMDLMFLVSGEVIAFHDMNLLDKTGLDLDILSASWSEIEDLTYLNSFDNLTYSVRAHIPLFKDVVNNLCSINSTIGLWLDIKTFLSPDYALSILDTFENSPCLCDENQFLILEVYNQNDAISFMDGLMKSFRCKFSFAFSFYKFEGDDTESVIQSKIDDYSNLANIFDFETTIVEKYSDLIQRLNDQQICVSLYGESNEYLTFKQNDEITILINDIRITDNSNQNFTSDDTSLKSSNSTGTNKSSSNANLYNHTIDSTNIFTSFSKYLKLELTAFVIPLLLYL